MACDKIPQLTHPRPPCRWRQRCQSSWASGQPGRQRRTRPARPAGQHRQCPCCPYGGLPPARCCPRGSAATMIRGSSSLCAPRWPRQGTHRRRASRGSHTAEALAAGSRRICAAPRCIKRIRRASGRDVNAKPVFRHLRECRNVGLRRLQASAAVVFIAVVR